MLHGKQLHRAAWCALLIAVVFGGIVCVAAPAPQSADDAVLVHLNFAIGWYRQLVAVDPGAGQPSDLLYLSNARAEAKQALQSAFQSAQAIATLQAQQKKADAGPASTVATGEQSTMPKVSRALCKKLRTP